MTRTDLELTVPQSQQHPSQPLVFSEPPQHGGCKLAGAGGEAETGEEEEGERGGPQLMPLLYEQGDKGKEFSVVRGRGAAHLR